MTNQELLEKLGGKTDIVIVGCGVAGTYLYNQIHRSVQSGQVVFCDNASEKQGKFDEYEVLSVKEATEQFPKAVYLISNLIYESVLREQLYSLGITEEQIVFTQTDELKNYLTSIKRKRKSQPLTELQFEVDIAAHCNLNCKCCSQFSSIADEEYIDLQILEKDLKRLSLLFGGRCKRIYLIGGEPLLHPKIADCMEMTRKYFPVGKISIFTNGLLLLQKDSRFWQVCKENKITLIVTKYPILFDYQSVLNKVQQMEVEFEYFQDSQDFKFMTNLGLDLNGTQNIETSFYNCREANECIKLRNGRLYTCTRPAAIYKFNKYFGTDLQVSGEDYIDIYKAHDAQEIMQELSKPIPFCRYCDILGERKAMVWGRTEGKIEEWT